MKLLINGYTVTETLELKRIETDLLKIDRYIEHIKRNKNKYRVLVILVAILIPSSTLQVFAATDALANAYSAGLRAYEMGKTIAKAICLLGWLTDSIKCVLSGSIEGLGKISTKWVSFALIVKFLPSVVEWIFSL